MVKETSTKLVANYYGTESLDNNVKTELFRVLNTQQQALNLKNAKLSEQQMRSLSQKVKFTEKTNDKKLNARDEKNLKTATFWFRLMAPSWHRILPVKRELKLWK